MNNRQYQGVQLSKKESELIQFLQTGSNIWFDAFYVYKHRRKITNFFSIDKRKQQSWFNSTLATLKKKGLALNVPFVIKGLAWINPGVGASKANLVAMSIQETNHDLSHRTKVI